jgi:acylphosphatase
MDRMEIQGFTDDLEGAYVDFQDGDVLVNFTFRKKDIEPLKNLVSELEKEFASCNEEKAKKGK